MWESLLRGTVVTVEVTVVAAVIAALVATIAGAARTSSFLGVRAVAGFYIELFRGTSALVQLYIAFFVLPFIGLTLTPFTAGVLAIGLNVGSYGAEIVRGGIQAVPVGQLEAAKALDMPRWPTFRRVVMPNAMLLILRPAGNALIDLLKLTSLVSLVTLQDLTFNANVLRAETGDTLSVYLVVLIIYFALSSLISLGINLVERRVRRGVDA